MSEISELKYKEGDKFIVAVVEIEQILSNSIVLSDGTQISKGAMKLYEPYTEPAHVEALEAELDRTRWHYPDKGEFPDKNCEVVGQSPDNNGNIFSNVYDYNDVDGFNILGILDIDIVTRWRYI